MMPEPIASPHPVQGDVTLTEQNRWMRGSSIVLGFCSLASGILTFQGLELAVKPMIAALLAAVSVILAYTCWKFLTSFFARAAAGVREGLALKVGLPTAVLVVLTSTLTGFAGIAAPVAMRHSLTELIDEAQSRLQVAEQAAAKEAALLPVLEAQASEWSEMAEDESARGRFLMKGKGAVYGGINGMARAFDSARATLQESGRHRHTAGQRAAAALASMRLTLDEAAHTDEGMREASRQIAAQLRLFNVAMTQLEQGQLDNILMTLETARQQQENAPLTAKRAQDRAREKTAKDSITAMTGEAMASVQAALGQPQEPRSANMPLRVPLPLEALSEQAVRIAPLAGFVVAIDLCLPLCILFMMVHLQSHLIRTVPASPARAETGDDHAPGKEPAAKLALIAEGLRRHRTNR